MKALLINTYPHGGGAAVAVRRAKEALEGAGIEVRVLYATDFGWRYRASFLTERADVYRTVRFDRQKLFRISTASTGIDLSTHPLVEWADVIHLHWVQQGYLSLRGLRRLFSLEHKRFFWTLHDLWALTGGCHIPYIIGSGGSTSFCHAFATHCGKCPLLGSRQPMDSTYRVFEEKCTWALERVHVIGVSHAVSALARQSRLFGKGKVSTLPNPIDLSQFSTRDVPPATERKLLFVAARADDPVKGLDLCRDMLCRAAKHSPHFQREAHLYIVGTVKDPQALEGFPIRVTQLGTLTQADLIRHYQEATLLLCTSRFETLGYTMIECMACGVPAVAFDVGGISDIIQPDSGNGALIPPYDTEAMALAVTEWSELHRTVDPQAIARTVHHFSHEVIGEQLVKLYKDGE